MQQLAARAVVDSAAGSCERLGMSQEQPVDLGEQDTDERPGIAGSLLGMAKAHAETLTGKASDLSEQAAQVANELKDASFAKWLETVADFNESLPIIREAGYTLMAVNIGIGVPPSMSAEFVVAEDIEETKVEALLEKYEARTFTKLMVKALFEAWKLQRKIQIVGLKPKNLQVDVGLIPVVTVKFG